MIYTTGYYGHQPEALKALADALDATVVDIRFMPASRVPGWRKQALQKLLVDAALKLEALQRRQNECAYTVPCQQCIHQACGSHKDNTLLAPITDPMVTPVDVMLAYAETVP